MIKFHKFIHEDGHLSCQFKYVVLSNDGVQESRSTGISLNVYSMMFIGCNLVFPLTISKAENVSPKCIPRTQDELLTPILDQFREAGLVIKHVSADAPKRAELR